MLTQKGIAEHLDLSQGKVSQWMERLAIDWKVMTIDEIRVEYIRALREQAAGRAAIGDLDLATERSRLAKEQADKIAMQNAVSRGELAPVVLIEEVLTTAAAKVAGVLDAIPGMVRRRVPRLASDEIELIAVEVAKARNVVASMSLDNLKAEESSGEKSDGNPMELIG